MDIEAAKKYLEMAILTTQRNKQSPESLESPEAHDDYFARATLERSIDTLREHGIEVPENAEEIVEEFEEGRLASEDPLDRSGTKYMENENSFYNDQDQRLEQEAESAGIPPEEYFPDHYVLYEDYLILTHGLDSSHQLYVERSEEYQENLESEMAEEAQRAGIPVKEYVKQHGLPYEEFLARLKDKIIKEREAESIEVETIKDATSEVRSTQVETVTSHVKDEIAQDNTKDQQKDTGFEQGD